VANETRRTRLASVAVGTIAVLAGVGPLLGAPAAGATPGAGRTSTTTTTSTIVRRDTTTRPTAPAAPPTTVAAAADPAFQPQEGSAEESRLLALLAAADAQRRQLDAQIADAEARVAALEADLATARAEQAAAQSTAADLATREDDAARALDAARARLDRAAVTAYVRGPADANRFVNLLLHGSSTDLAVADGYTAEVVSSRTDAARRAREAKAEVAALRSQADRASTDAAARTADTEARAQAAASAQVALDGLRQQVASHTADAEKLKGLVFASKGVFEAQIALLQRESDATATLLRGLQGGQAPAAAGRGTLVAPIPGAAVTSPFGPRVHPVFGDVRMHTGVDFAATEGTPIHAAADGVVASAAMTEGYGNMTVITHPGAIATVYAHQSQLLVVAGQQVRRGDVIGAVGCTGSCTGPHLHFEVRVDGTPVDPMGWL